MMTAKEVATILDVSLGFVYRHRNALGGFQPLPGAAVRFSENVIESIKEGTYAVSDAQRQMAGKAHDRRNSQNEDLSNQARGKKMGGNAKRKGMARRPVEDPYGILS